MPTITKISEQKRRPSRRNVYLDGSFAFAVNLNVVARFRLREGNILTAEQVTAIEQGGVRQECFDRATQFLQMRLHSRAELSRKLLRREFGHAVIDSVLDQLTELGYVNDERFAGTKALYASERKHHGRQRARIELFKSGIRGEVAERALNEVYNGADTVGVARMLARKQAPRLQKLDPMVARRRLAGMLLRRGFDYETVKPIIDETLGEATE
ncbi:MAG TPA: RecX family transcriptional regulator [Tepidisphaeraceae bacterium]|jgi:regulatory protein|nr:RecX family transcriptional regulator [Tepidisphaeraceae bacterium]